MAHNIKLQEQLSEAAGKHLMHFMHTHTCFPAASLSCGLSCTPHTKTFRYIYAYVHTTHTWCRWAVLHAAYKNIYVHLCIHADTHTHMWTKHLHTFMHVYLHTFMHTCIQTHTHTWCRRAVLHAAESWTQAIMVTDKCVYSCVCIYVCI